MTRFYFMAALGFTAAGFTAFAFGQDEPLPKAETILDRYVEVTGGKAAYEKCKNLVETGTFEMAAAGLKGVLTRYSADPAQEYSVIEIDGVGKVEEGVDKGMAWEKNPMLGSRIKTGGEKAQALRGGVFNESIRWREVYPKVETIGTETLDGELCYKVLLTPKEGNSETMYFQKKTGFAVKVVTIAVSQMGDVPMEGYSSNYKNFEGLSIPTKLTQKFGGQEITITIQDVKMNQPLPADRFDPPADIKVLLSKPVEKK
jgi:hypothetical protein